MSLSPREILAKKREAQGALLAEVTADLGAKMHDHFRAAVRDTVREVLPEVLDELRQTEGSAR